ncbi:AAA family ATPase [Pseudarthrobacter sp. B907]|uniref:AAA family ATPase n=1 Tax=Pseudarthrobacter sp. B907 TaxID=3158261 RepID=UPI0032DB0042
MPLDASGYQILGASIFGPEPLSGIHLDVRPGSTMLYGKNGTGKTRLLDALTQAFQGAGQPKMGSRTRTLIHTSVEVPTSSGDSNFVSALYGMLDISRDLQVTDEYREEFQSGVLGRVNAWEELDLDDPLDLIEYPELKTSQGFHLSLMPSGTPESSRWTVYLSAILGEEDIQQLAKYGNFLSQIRRAMIEGTSLDDESLSTTAPFALAKADEWYAEPFTAVRRDAAPEYVSAGSSPLDGWPPHIPVPLAAIGYVSRGPAQVFVNSLPLDVIQEKTLSLVSKSQWKAPIVEATAGSEMVLAESVQQSVALAETETNRILNVLADFPFWLKFDTRSPSDWFAGKPPRWVAVARHDEATKMRLDDLSFSQQKWVRFALSLYLSKSDLNEPRLIVVDEPEQGLHRQLESRISKGLHRLVAEFDDVAVVGATHSPSFLDPRLGSHLLHLTLTGLGGTVVSDLEVGHLSLDEESKRLGVAPSDILAMTRVALVVEGTHDQIVLEQCLSEHLRASGARVFVMRGTDHAAALPDMQFLFDALEAPIVVVFDNVVQKRVMAIWQRAVSAFQAKNSRLAERTISELESNSSTKEERALAELGRRAIRVGRLSRITPFGLGQPDILDYLAPTHFGLEDGDWQTYKAGFRARRKPSESFKDFLRREYGAKISIDAVRHAAKAMGALPDDLADLGVLVRKLGFLGAIDDLEAAVADD